MSVLSKALNDLRFKIPEDILKIAFTPNNTFRWRNAPTSLDEEIRSQVIRPRVMVDLNIFAHKRVSISLGDVPCEQIENFVWIYEIPMEKLDNREIVSVLSVHYMPVYNQMGFTGYGYGNSIMQPVSDALIAGQRAVDSHSSIPNTSSAQVNLIGQNTVLIRDPFRANRPYHLLCVIANDPELNNIDYRSQDYVNKMVELAVKAYIYNTLRIKVNRGFLEAGVEIAAVREYIESIADSEQMYQDFKQEQMGAVLVMNERDIYTDLIRLQVNPAL